MINESKIKKSLDKIEKHLAIIKEEMDKERSHFEVDVSDFISYFVNTNGVYKSYLALNHGNKVIERYKPDGDDYREIEARSIYLKDLRKYLVSRGKVEVEFSYTDGDWPYAHQPSTVVVLDSIDEIEPWINENSVRRDRYSLLSINWAS